MAVHDVEVNNSTRGDIALIHEDWDIAEEPSPAPDVSSDVAICENSAVHWSNTRPLLGPPMS